MPVPTTTPATELNAALYLQGPSVWCAQACSSCLSIERAMPAAYSMSCHHGHAASNRVFSKLLQCSSRPVTTAELILLVDAFANTMTTIQASDVNILNVAKVRLTECAVCKYLEVNPKQHRVLTCAHRLAAIAGRRYKAFVAVALRHRCSDYSSDDGILRKPDGADCCRVGQRCEHWQPSGAYLTSEHST
jgi:hypothetical protein